MRGLLEDPVKTLTQFMRTLTLGPNHHPVPTFTCHSLEIPFSHSTLQQHKLSLHSRSHSSHMYAHPSLHIWSHISVYMYVRNPSLHICTYFSVYMYVYASLSTRIYAHPSLHKCMHIPVYTYVRTSQSTCMYTHPILHNVHTSQPTHMYAHPNLHVCTHEFIVGTLCSAQSCPSPPPCMLKAVT